MKDKPASMIGLRSQIRREVFAMAEYAYTSGMKVPPKILHDLELLEDKKQFDEKEGGTPQDPKHACLLSSIHGKLSDLIAPAKPRTILLLAREANRGRISRLMGSVPLVRQMMVVTFISIALFIGFGLSSYVNVEGGDILTSSGIDLLMNQLFFIAAAGLGASFYALFQANQYIIEGSFDPKYESTYWTRFTLGILAGIVLAGLIPLEKSAALKDFGKPLLAMLGGFSSNVVYRILTRLVETVESLIQGSTKAALKAGVEAAELQAEGKVSGVRLKLAGDLMTLQKSLAAGSDGEQIKKDLDAMVAQLLPGENDDR